MIEVGKKYYFIVHAYFHYLGEVMEVISSRRVKIRNVIQVHSCARNWTQFFADGCKDDTQYDVLPDGVEFDYSLPVTPWPHEIPTTKGRRQ